MKLRPEIVAKILRGEYEQFGYASPVVTIAEWQRIKERAFDIHGLPYNVPPWDLAKAEGFVVQRLKTGFRRTSHTYGGVIRVCPRPDPKEELLECHHERVHGWADKLNIEHDEPDAWIGTMVLTAECMDTLPKWWAELVAEVSGLYTLQIFKHFLRCFVYCEK